MTAPLSELEQTVRFQIYQSFVGAGRAPAPAEIAAAISLPVAEITAALRGLAHAHVLVLVPGQTRIWMAHPFSAFPTAYRVEVGARSWWAPCIWDALGIPAAVSADAVIRSRCPGSDSPFELVTEDARVTNPTGTVHFLVPAARWWDDIGFT